MDIREIWLVAKGQCGERKRRERRNERRGGKSLEVLYKCRYLKERN
jgi:hypothetical protein